MKLQRRFAILSLVSMLAAAPLIRASSLLPARQAIVRFEQVAPKNEGLMTEIRTWQTTTVAAQPRQATEIEQASVVTARPQQAPEKEKPQVMAARATQAVESERAQVAAKLQQAAEIERPKTMVTRPKQTVEIEKPNTAATPVAQEPAAFDKLSIRADEKPEDVKKAANHKASQPLPSQRIHSKQPGPLSRPTHSVPAPTNPAPMRLPTQMPGTTGHSKPVSHQTSRPGPAHLRSHHAQHHKITQLRARRPARKMRLRQSRKRRREEHEKYYHRIRYGARASKLGRRPPRALAESVRIARKMIHAQASRLMRAEGQRRRRLRWEKQERGWSRWMQEAGKAQRRERRRMRQENLRARQERQWVREERRQIHEARRREMRRMREERRR